MTTQNIFNFDYDDFITGTKEIETSNISLKCPLNVTLFFQGMIYYFKKTFYFDSFWFFFILHSYSGFNQLTSHYL